MCLDISRSKNTLWSWLITLLRILFWNTDRYVTNGIRNTSAFCQCITRRRFVAGIQQFNDLYAQHFCCPPTPRFEPSLVSDFLCARNVKAALRAPDLISLWFRVQYLPSQRLWKTCHTIFCRSNNNGYSADSRFAPSQWETALLCNDVSHWLGTNLESALYMSYSCVSLHRLTHWCKDSMVVCRQHFQMSFREWKLLYFDHDFTDVCSQGNDVPKHRWLAGARG